MSRTYTQAELNERLEQARAASREKAWLDLMGKFSSQDRRHVANLLAHKWHVGAVTVSCAWAGSSTVYAEGQPHTGPATSEDYFQALDALEKIAKEGGPAMRGRIADVLRPLLARDAGGVNVDAPADPIPALRRLLPVIEKALRGFVFTADKAGEVAADMAVLRAACGVKTCDGAQQ